MIRAVLPVALFLATLAAAESGNGPTGPQVRITLPPSLDPTRADSLSDDARQRIRTTSVAVVQPTRDSPLSRGLRRLAEADSRYDLRTASRPGSRWLADGGHGFYASGSSGGIEQHLKGLTSRVSAYAPQVAVAGLAANDLPSGTRVPTPFLQYRATMEIRIASAVHQGSMQELISAPRVISNGNGGGVVIPGLPYPIELPNVAVAEIATTVQVPAGAGLAPADLRPAPPPPPRPNLRDAHVAWPALRDTVAGLRRDHPDTRIVWTTMPLEPAENLQRNWFNEQVRLHATERGEPLFDVAALQAVASDGTLARDGQGPVLAQEWRSEFPNGVMNEAGEDRLARAWWVFLDTLAQPSVP